MVIAVEIETFLPYLEEIFVAYALPILKTEVELSRAIIMWLIVATRALEMV